MNWSAAPVALVPTAVVTVTSTGPAAPGGEVAVSWVEEVTVYVPAATAPKSSALAPVNPVPVTLTEVPPAGRPAMGLMALTVGAAS